MKNAIKWAVNNGPAVNVIVITTLLAGLGSFLMMRRETFPEFQLDVILVSVPYPGASPDEVETGICQKVEEEVQSLAGIKRLVSIAREGGGFCLIELETSVKDSQRVLSEVRSAVDRVSAFFPQRSEKSTVEQITFRQPAIRLAVIGPDDRSPEAEYRLRQVTEQVRERLLELPEVSQAQIVGAKPFQIDVEVSEETLRNYGLTLSQIAQILRRESIETPGGQMKTEGQEILLRGMNKRETSEEIANLPVIARPNGVVLTVGDIGKVVDDFDDVTSISEINGRPALVLTVERTSDEDLLKIADAVEAFAERDATEPGFQLKAWGDESIDVRDRMNMLIENGIQGAIIVFVLLALFLDIKLAFWVAMGIPISVMGAGIVLIGTGQTLNMLSMFAFLMAIGIVVDDAIVIGENIYSHRLMGKSHRQAALDGATEVLPSVFSSVATTVVAFIPLFYVAGVMGKFIAVMPVAIIAMLLISLAEASFALPGHLAHGAQNEKSFFSRLFHRFTAPLRSVNTLLDIATEKFSTRIYQPMLVITFRYPGIPISVACFLFIFTFGLIRSGIVPFNAFPKLDGTTIVGKITYPDGTPVALADQATRHIEQTIRQVSEDIYRKELEKAGKPVPENPDPLSPRGPVVLTFRQVGQITGQGPAASTQGSTGSHVGQVQVELLDATLRSVTSAELIALWRKASGDFPGAERVVFDSENIGPGGAALEFKVLAPRDQQDELEAAVERCKTQLATYAGVYDIRDDSSPGKFEFQIRIKDNATSLGITNEQLTETVRAAYYGVEVMRLQRGRNEVKLMVRYPKEQRRSISDFQEIRVRGSDGIERPITELAEIKFPRGYSEINRLDQFRSITVTASLDESKANSQEIVQRLKSEFLPLVQSEFKSVRFRWEGQAQETAESINSLLIGFILALLGIYALLVLEFRSYLQPFLILAVIPFGIVGAVFGHAFMGLPITLFSIFGLVSLTGVVVNDSIVLLDFINLKRSEGMPLQEALMQAGVRRMRPVFLTSVTTVAGLMPILLEKSLQAQLVVPMATSIAFGIIASTMVVLFLVPNLYWFYVFVGRLLGYDEEAVHHTDDDANSNANPSLTPALNELEPAQI